MDKNKLHVLKRDGSKEIVSEDKIKEHLNVLMDGLNTNYINLDVVCAKVCKGIYDGVTTQILDNLAVETCAYMSIIHPDYSKLAARIAVTNLHKMTDSSFLNTTEKLFYYKDKQGNKLTLFIKFYKIFYQLIFKLFKSNQL